MAITLRPYQVYCEDEFFKAVDAGMKDICIAIKTGTGKTHTSASIAKRFLDNDGIIIFIAPRINLVYQTVRSFEYLGDIQIIQGGNKFDQTGKVYIASSATLIRRDFAFTPTLIIIDESHNGYNGKGRKIIKEKFPDSIFLSLTATPFDAKGWPLEGFDKIIQYETTQWFIDNGYLVDCECYAPVMPDLSKVKITAGDYNEKELDAVMNNKVMIGNIVDETKDRIVGKKSLFFAVTIAHAEAVAEKYQSVGINAVTYHSAIHDELREEILKSFNDGNIDVLVSVSALVMGFDVPSVDCLIIARPTKSQSFYRQLIGRGMRPSPGKTYCLVIDCAGTIKENGMPHQEVVPKKKDTREEKLMECNECGQKAKPISKSLRKVMGVLNYVTTWSCPKGHTFETEKEAGFTSCPSCTMIIPPGGAQFRETDEQYEVYAVCGNCGEEIVIRAIPKIKTKLEKIESSRVTVVDLINKIGLSTKDPQRDMVNKFVRYVLDVIHPEMQQQCLSSLYVSLSMGLDDEDIKKSLRQATIDASLRTNQFGCLSTELLRDAYNQTKDPANIIHMHNSRAANPMPSAFLTKTIAKMQEFQLDFPSSKNWLLKAVKTRCKNINERKQKMASLFYFFDLLRDKENGGIE